MNYNPNFLHLPVEQTLALEEMLQEINHDNSLSDQLDELEKTHGAYLEKVA